MGRTLTLMIIRDNNILKEKRRDPPNCVVFFILPPMSFFFFFRISTFKQLAPQTSDLFISSCSTAFTIHSPELTRTDTWNTHIHIGVLVLLLKREVLSSVRCPIHIPILLRLSGQARIGETVWCSRLPVWGSSYRIPVTTVSCFSPCNCWNFY